MAKTEKEKRIAKEIRAMKAKYNEIHTESVHTLF